MEAQESPLIWEALEASSKDWKGSSPLVQCQAPLFPASPACTDWEFLAQRPPWGRPAWSTPPPQPEGRELPPCQPQDTDFWGRSSGGGEFR